MKWKTSLRFSFYLSLMLVLGGQFSCLPFADAQVFTMERVGEVPPSHGVKVQVIEALQILDSDPNTLLFVSRNQGAGCGGGTPVSIWKMTLDRNTGLMTDLEYVQTLSRIQTARGDLFESSMGTLFTGGGWCGYKPPYYSTDDGASWRPAERGVHPPNSTFSFVEFKGQVYAGTGYAPYHAQVYRWLGEAGSNNWELVFDVPTPRTIMEAMAEYGGKLFVAPRIYGGDNWQGSVPVYISSDGTTFQPTTGIPDSYSVNTAGLIVVGDQLVAIARRVSTQDDRLYHWDSGNGQWIEMGPYPLNNISVSGEGTRIVAHNDVLYALGRALSDPLPGIYQSVDLGQTWHQIATLENTNPSTLTIHGDILYIGTDHDGSDTAYVYRIPLESDAICDTNTNHCYQRFDDTMSWHMANAYCEDKNGYLATITSQEEQDFVFNNVLSRSPNDVWIGASDEGTENAWRWGTGEQWNYSNWGSGEPDNCAGLEHYGALSTLDGTWSDQVSLNNGTGSCDCPVVFAPMSTICEWGEIPGDVNGDNKVNAEDYDAMRQAFGQCSGDSGFNSRADYDEDGCVTYRDYWNWFAYAPRQP